MKQIVPFIAGKPIEIFDSIPSENEIIEFKKLNVNSIEEGLDCCTEDSGVIVIDVSSDLDQFMVKLPRINKKLKQDMIVLGVYIDKSIENKRDEIVEAARKFELIFCFASINERLFRSEIMDLISFRKYLVSIQSKSDQFKIMAYQAMETAAEIGLITLLLEKSINIQNLDEMMEALFDTMKALNANGSILYTSQVYLEEHYFSDDQEYKDKEKKILSAFKCHVSENDSAARFKTFSGRLLVSGKFITLLIRNLPDGEEEQGRIRDTFGAFINAADLIAANIEAKIAKNKRDQIISQTVSSVASAVQQVHAMFKGHEEITMKTMDQLMRNTEEGLSILGLTEEQENYFLNQLEDAMKNLIEMYSTGMAIEGQFDSIVSNINNIRQIS